MLHKWLLAHPKLKFCFFGTFWKIFPQIYSNCCGYKGLTVYLSLFIYFSIAKIYVICNFSLFQTILLWTFLCTLSFAHVQEFLYDIPNKELLSLEVYISSIFSDIVKFLSNIILYNLPYQQCMRVPDTPLPH